MSGEVLRAHSAACTAKANALRESAKYYSGPTPLILRAMEKAERQAAQMYCDMATISEGKTP